MTPTERLTSEERLEQLTGRIRGLGHLAALNWVQVANPLYRQQGFVSTWAYDGWSDLVHDLRSLKNLIRQVIEHPRATDAHKAAVEPFRAFTDAIVPHLRSTDPVDDDTLELIRFLNGGEDPAVTLCHATDDDEEA